MSASEGPLVWTFRTSIPAENRKRSKFMWVALPTPASEQASLPGCAFAAATKSATLLYPFCGEVIMMLGIVATVATGCSSLGLSVSGLSSVETVNAEAYIMMLWPSGSDCATYFAPTRPPAPSRFSTMTG